MLFTLEIPSEAVSAEHLERAEQYKQAQPFHKMTYRGNFSIKLQRVVILVNKLSPELIRISGRCLPKE